LATSTRLQVLPDGTHDLARAQKVTETVLAYTYKVGYWQLYTSQP